MIKKFINFRPIFLCAVMLFFGIIFAKEILDLKIFAIIFCSVLIIALIVWTILQKKPAIVIVGICAFIIGFGAFLIIDKTYIPSDFNQENHEVTGRVENINVDSQSYQSFILDDIVIGGKDYNKKIYVKSQVFGNGVEVGDVVKFTSFVSTAKMWDLGDYQSFFYKNSVAFFCETSSADINIVSHKESFSDKVRGKVKNVLYKNMKEENAAICYAAIFGDKTGIEETVTNAFSSVGVAHLLAISGLHIGFFVLVFVWILNKLHLKKKWHILIISPILLFYCYLCGFSASVVRASVMAIIFLLAQTFGEKYDSLTTIGLAYLVVVLPRPMLAFDAGTQLSFMSVISILLLAPILRKCFDKLKLGKLSSALSVIIAVQIGIMPIIMKIFGSVSILTVLANLICIPIFEFAYISLMCLLPIALVIPVASVILVAPEFLIHTISVTCIALSQSSSLEITHAYTGKVFTISYAIILFAISRFVMGSMKEKALIICSLFFLTSLLIGVDRIQNGMKNNNIGFVDLQGESVYIVEEGGEYYLINFSNKYNNNLNKIEKYLNNLKIYSINYVINASNEKIDNIYQTKNSTFIEEDVEEKIELFKPKDNKIKMIVLTFDNNKIAFIERMTDETEIENTIYYYENTKFDVLVLKGTNPLNLDYEYQIKDEEINSLSNFTLSFGCDKLGDVRRVD